MGLRHRRGGTDIWHPVASTAPTASRRAPGHGDRDRHVGAGVLDRLERSDRATELLSHHGVRHGRCQHALGQARGRRGDGHRRSVGRRCRPSLAAHRPGSGSAAAVPSAQGVRQGPVSMSTGVCGSTMTPAAGQQGAATPVGVGHDGQQPVGAFSVGPGGGPRPVDRRGGRRRDRHGRLTGPRRPRVSS